MYIIIASVAVGFYFVVASRMFSWISIKEQYKLYYTAYSFASGITVLSKAFSIWNFCSFIFRQVFW